MNAWQQQGDRLLIFIDANENMKSGKLARGLRRLKLRDLVRERTSQDGPNTHHCGSEQIDGVWASDGLDCAGARFLPFWWGAGDHRAMVVDIPWSSLIGKKLLQIPRPKFCRLQWTDTVGKKRYLEIVSEQWKRHKMNDKISHLRHLDSGHKDHPHHLEQLDQQRVDIMTCAEKKCKKVRAGNVEFSPGVNIWKKRREVWGWS